MGTVAEHEKRSQEIADTTRRVVITLNSGGIGVVFGVAGTLAGKGVHATWAVLPVAIFVLGLLITLSAVVASSWYVTRQISGLLELQRAQVVRDSFPEGRGAG